MRLYLSLARDVDGSLSAQANLGVESPEVPLMGHEDVDSEGEIRGGMGDNAGEQAACLPQQQCISGGTDDGGKPLRMCYSKGDGYDGERGPAECSHRHGRKLFIGQVAQQE